MSYEKQGGHRRFIVQRQRPRRVMLGPLLEQKRDWLPQRAGRFIVGQQPEGDVLCADLSDSSTPQLLVAGQAGSGKSVLLQRSSRARFSIIRPKPSASCSWTPSASPSTAPPSGAPSRPTSRPDSSRNRGHPPALEQLIEVMEERYELFERAQVMDLEEYNEQAQPAERLYRRVLVIDEFQDLFADESSSKAFFDGVRRLGAKARAARVHLILATQRRDKDTVPPIIRANLGGKIALRVTSLANSRIILGENGAVLGKGDLLANLGGGTVRAQAPLLGKR